ncbi:hypothetical protein GGR56DRAFT_8785 [Xylariaceae sp. FL0804]|nr:hypothetical protein GGR56DRAFT_8785 [Xylariaceae sp. FL0804]
MSTPERPSPPPALSDITRIVPEAFEANKPLIADIVRTRFCIPGSVFLVESVDTLHTSRSRRWRAMRLLLGDGELCIQALLGPGMHRHVDRGEVAFGTYVRLEQFRVEWKGMVDERRGEEAAALKRAGVGDDPEDEREGMLYLVVEDLVVVGWNNALVDSADNSSPEPALNSPRDDEMLETSSPGSHGSEVDGDEHSRPAALVADAHDELLPTPANVGDVADEPVSTARKQRQQHLNDGQTDRVNHPAAAISAEATSIASASASTSWLPPWPAGGISAAAAAAVAVVDVKPVKLTRLRSIPNLPYKQNWSVNVLAVVSALSAVEPSGLPPGPGPHGSRSRSVQRQARLADPSTDKRVLLTVFLDAEAFAPRVGSAVLLLGVKNHRFDGGCLKKYASDRPRDGDGDGDGEGNGAGGRWWFEDPLHLPWCDVAGLKQWWRGEVRDPS